MSKKIKRYKVGDCVEVSMWAHGKDDFFTPAKGIGIVLEVELVDMDVNEGAGVHDKQEWLYRVVLTDGTITEQWDYEIKLVNRAA